MSCNTIASEVNWLWTDYEISNVQDECSAITKLYADLCKCQPGLQKNKSLPEESRKQEKRESRWVSWWHMKALSLRSSNNSYKKEPEGHQVRHISKEKISANNLDVNHNGVSRLLSQYLSHLWWAAGCIERHQFPKQKTDHSLLICKNVTCKDYPAVERQQLQIFRSLNSTTTTCLSSLVLAVLLVMPEWQKALVTSLSEPQHLTMGFQFTLQVCLKYLSAKGI